MADMLLRMTDGTQIAVPASLDAMTTYVILEQETWFEKEMAFVARWLRPGMTAIDIGANLGGLQPSDGAAGRTRGPGFRL